MIQQNLSRGSLLKFLWPCAELFLMKHTIVVFSEWAECGKTPGNGVSVQLYSISQASNRDSPLLSPYQCRLICNGFWVINYTKTKFCVTQTMFYILRSLYFNMNIHSLWELWVAPAWKKCAGNYFSSNYCKYTHLLRLLLLIPRGLEFDETIKKIWRIHKT